jgi:pantoate--beta-alanine ligase
VPEVKDFYAENFATYVTVEGLQDRLCGRVRPGHFRGVTTVVLKLLNIVDPHFLIMGAKDGQQIVVVRRMLRDLNLAAELVVAPTVREADGLAMSSRNANLSAEARAAAPVLYRALSRAEELYAAGERDPRALVAAARTVLESEPLATVDYVELVEPETLDPVGELGGVAMLAVAIRLGTTRLIDNLLLGRGPAPA